MATFEEQIQKACDAREIPGVVLLASNASGTFKYEKAFGPKTPTEPMDLNATFVMASCTKLMTTIAALQCVERGQIGLDDDVSNVLPELQDIKILTGFKETGEPTYAKATKTITLRKLLTHTSGFGYDVMDPRYMQWRGYRNETLQLRDKPLLSRIETPLLFEPGTSWMYGTGLDWTGILVGRLNHTTLESFMDTNIWAPLGIKNFTFHLEKKPDVLKNLAKMTLRKGTPALMTMPTRTDEGVEWSDDELYPYPNVDEYGGEGSTGSAVDYMKIMHSILSNDGKLLKLSSIDQMFTPQFNPSELAGYEEFRKLPFMLDTFASVKLGTKCSWGLGGFMVLEDYETGRKKTTLSWSGLPNLCWTIDRVGGLALFYASNVCPPGDYQSAKWQVAFETEMYKRFTDSEKK